jgi:predicted HTH domain antitoxin
MALTIKLDLPRDIEERLRAEGVNVDAEVKEAFAIELFRRGKLSHYELSQLLSLDRFQTDAYLKQHQIFEGSQKWDDLESDHVTIERVLSPKKT